jgi:hypothetical protein
MTGQEFRQQIITLVIGALVGLIPSLVVVTYQGKQEREQFLLDRKLTALKDFSAALTGDGDMLAKYDELEIVTARLIRFPDSSNAQDDFVRLSGDAMLLQDRYDAKMQTQALVMSSMFGLRFPTSRFVSALRLDPADVSNIPSVNGKERIRLCRELLKKIPDLKDGQIEIISDYEAVLNRIAIQIR